MNGSLVTHMLIPDQEKFLKNSIYHFLTLYINFDTIIFILSNFLDLKNCY